MKGRKMREFKCSIVFDNGKTSGMFTKEGYFTSEGVDWIYDNDQAYALIKNYVPSLVKLSWEVAKLGRLYHSLKNGVQYADDKINEAGNNYGLSLAKHTVSYVLLEANGILGITPNGITRLAEILSDPRCRPESSKDNDVFEDPCFDNKRFEEISREVEGELAEVKRAITRGIVGKVTLSVAKAWEKINTPILGKSYKLPYVDELGYVLKAMDNK